MQKKNDSTSKVICINCINCKIKNNTVKCKLGYFGKINIKKAYFLFPLDYDCYEYSGMD